MGSVEIPAIIPTNIPRKERPTCEMVKPWLVVKTKSKAPKNRYKTPNRIAENRQRFRHIGSRSRSWNGRIREYIIVFGIDLFDYNGINMWPQRSTLTKTHLFQWCFPSLFSGL